MLNRSRYKIYENKRKTKGFALIDALVGVVIASILSAAFLSSIYQASIASSYARDQLTASLAMLEMYEVATSFSQNNFSALSIASCTESSPCHFKHNGSTWSIEIGPEIFNERFERSFSLANVSRANVGGEGNIVSSGGYNDPKTLELTTTVTWESRGEDFSEELTTYLHQINP